MVSMWNVILKRKEVNANYEQFIEFLQNKGV